VPSCSFRDRAQRKADVKPDFAQAVGYLLPGVQNR
jgi:hypothetical protein